VEQSAAEWQHLGSSAVGEEAEVADAGKASRQHMLYEAAQELFSGKCHGALLAVVSIVLPVRRHFYNHGPGEMGVCRPGISKYWRSAAKLSYSHYKRNQLLMGTQVICAMRLAWATWMTENYDEYGSCGPY
jgi:hypothetical protein